jgi:hypothetical protein
LTADVEVSDSKADKDPTLPPRGTPGQQNSDILAKLRSYAIGGPKHGFYLGLEKQQRFLLRSDVSGRKKQGQLAVYGSHFG